MPIRPPIISPFGPAISRPFDSGPAYLPPVPPGPSAPLNIPVQADDALVSFSQGITIANPVLIVRVDARNNAASAPGMSWAVNGTPMLRAGSEIHDSTVGGPVCAFYYLTGLTAGAKTLTCTSTGSSGRGVVRLGELQSMTGIGSIQSLIATNYLLDVSITPQSASSDISQQAVWMSDTAYPIDQFYGATLQYQGVVASLSTELITNGDFATDTIWTKGSGWTIAGGVANRSVGAGGTILWQTVAGVTANRYMNSFDIVSTVSGGMQPYWRTASGWAAASGIVSAVGHYDIPVQGSAQYIGFGLQGTGNPAPGTSIDNVSLKQILGGTSSWFGRQPSVSTSARTYTYEATQMTGVKGAALVVEILGAVLP